MKRMKNKSERWRNIVILILFIWTCLFFFISIKRFHFVNNMEKTIIKNMEKEQFPALLYYKSEKSIKGQILEHVLKNHALLGYALEQDITTEKEEKKSGTDNPEEEYTEPTQTILLFNNGSTDITSRNQTVEEKETEIRKVVATDSKDALVSNFKKIEKLKKSYSRSYLLKNFYITDSSTSIDNAIFQVKTLLTIDLTMEKKKEPQILIIHTHGASEAFIDSKKGEIDDSIIGVGSVLAQILSEQYGYQVLHDKTQYDKVNGQIDRNKAYNQAYLGIKKTLDKYPSIQVVIDLHRDGVGNKVKRTTIVDGKRTAQAMFFNGLSRNASGNIEYLENNNLQGNLAFSLQLELACMERFQNFAKPVYLKGYRYNMHLRKRYTLIELGNENNTVEEEKNAAAPLAMAIDAVLQGKR